MKKFFFPVIALLLASCSSNENTINEPDPIPESPKYIINSSIQLDGIKLESYIFEENYYIEATDKSNNKMFTIKDKAEDFTEDLGYGAKQEYIVDGCYIQSAIKRGDEIYLLVSLYANLVYCPHKFIIKIKNNVVDNRIFFDVKDSDEGKFYPASMVDWYGNTIAIYSLNMMMDGYCFSVLDEDLNNQYYSMNTDGGAIDNLNRGNYICISKYNILYVDLSRKYVCCFDLSFPYKQIWNAKITDEKDVVLNKATYLLEGDNVIVDVDAITKAGEKKKYHLTLNKDTGNLIL